MTCTEHITQIVSEYVYKLQYEDLPRQVVETTKMFMLDYYAAAFAGMKVNQKFNRAIEDILEDMGGKEECDFLCSSRRLPCMQAAFLNACYAHGADMDDGNRKAMGHIGAHVISTVLTMAQTLAVTGKDIVVAINAGYEVYNRISAALQPGLVRRGFHSTGTVGAIACGAACAKLMGLSQKEIYNTMALSAIQASGLILIAESGQSCKPINPANAARAGILSAQMISRGVESSVYPLESDKGFFHAMSDEVDVQAIVGDLGEVFTICESYMKPYPSCRHTHCGIECALLLHERIPSIEAVKNVKVYIYGNAIRIAGQIRVPREMDDTKFSVHYSLAAALKRGHFDLRDLSLDELEDLISLIDKIELIEDPTMENREEGIRGSRVEIELTDGTVLEETVLIPLGDAAKPFTIQQLKEKLAACAEGIISEEQQERLTENLWTLEQKEKITTINLFELKEEA